MNIHLIAIGGSIMHNLALELDKKNINITGSDDIIFEPSKTRLKNSGLLPKKLGWFPEKINKKIDLVILGMHARINNPELIKARKLKIPIYSYPEYIYKNTTNKKRIVIGGSHGKTSVTSMILHILKFYKVKTDYIVGAKISGFNRMVKLTSEAKIIILEGDEYLSSVLDKRPKFHLYKPHIAVLTGISWDHINVFPSFKNYIEQFRIFKEDVKDVLIYCKDDIVLSNLVKEKKSCRLIEYGTPEHEIIKQKTYLINKNKRFPLKIFGEHNLQNINAARLVCNQLGISDEKIYEAIIKFKGANNRLESVVKYKNTSIYKDFAHSPSKLKATISAMKQQFPNRKLIACMELYTFSSLTKKFLEEYKGSMDHADIALVYLDQMAIKNKGRTVLKKKDIIKNFGRNDLIVFTESEELTKHLKSINWNFKNLLMMSSGNFGGINIKQLIKR